MDFPLPFSASSPVDEVDISELFRDGYVNCKFPLDGIVGFFSVRFATSNAKEMASYFQFAMGFELVAQKGLETGSSLIASHVLKNGKAVVEIVTSIKVASEEADDGENLAALFGNDTNSVSLARLVSQYEEVRQQKKPDVAYDALLAYLSDTFVGRHGMGVIDILLGVTDVDSTYSRAICNGALSLEVPHILSDCHGVVRLAKIGVPGTDMHHTLVQKVDYDGVYLPGYKTSLCNNQAQLPFAPVSICEIDHCVQNYSWNEMFKYARFYASALGLHKYWSVDESDVSTTNTALRSLVMASANGKVKMPINEPAESKLVGQIEEFYQYFNGPGVQHIALRTRDILQCVCSMRTRGVDFNEMSSDYYEGLMARLAEHNIVLTEDMDKLRANHILVDFDPATRFARKNGTFGCNYILQIFTKPLHDRPTFFFEIIQRHHHNGFGKGTFKGLFETIERQQQLRGTLVPSNRRNI